MRLTDYIKDLGRVIAFYPNLKRVTDSTVASILLCQLLYWTDKTEDGWIYKTHYDLEEETGLTYFEQRTARRVLIDLGIVEEEYKRLDHKIRFKINQAVLNDLWEKEISVYTGKEKPDNLLDYKDPDLIIPYKKSTPRTIPGKKGDLVDGVIAFSTSPGMKKEAIKNEIRDKLYNLLHVNVDGKRWSDFVEFAYQRQEKHGEPIDKFIRWAIKSGFNPIYWTPEKCQSVYPQAFLEDTTGKPREDFVEEPPEQGVEEENLIPMPEEMKRKKRLY